MEGSGSGVLSGREGGEGGGGGKGHFSSSQRRWMSSDSGSGASSSEVNRQRQGGGHSGAEMASGSSSSIARKQWSKVHNVDTKPSESGGGSSPKEISKNRVAGSTRASHSSSDADQNFLTYLPQDDAVLDASETQEVVDLMNKQLSTLLRLPFRQFWKTAAADKSLAVFLDSYLQYKKRWFDVPTRSSNDSDISLVVGDGDLSRRVFVVLLRLTARSEPGAPTSEILSEDEHASILKKMHLIDVPKLIDISAIFGNDNLNLTKRLVSTIFSALPRYEEELAAYVSPLLRRLITMHQRCCDTVQTITTHNICSDTVEALVGPGEPNHFVGADRIRQELLEIVDFLNDVVFSLNAFVLVYPAAARTLMAPGDSNQGLFLPVLAALHDTLLPNIEEGFSVMAKNGSNEHGGSENVRQSRLSRLRVKLQDYVWLLLKTHYLVREPSDGVPAQENVREDSGDDATARGYSFVQDIASLSLGPSADLLELGSSRLVCTGALLKSIERRHGLLDQVLQARQEGTLVLDDAQQEYLFALLMDEQVLESTKVPGLSTLSHVPRLTLPETEAEDDTVFRQSKISQVKDLFPALGEGFIDACLEVYDNDPEKVIQKVLEGTLHPDLSSLDTTLAVKPNQSGKLPHVNDKGKSKMFEAPEQRNAWENRSLSVAGTSSRSSMGDSSSSSGPGKALVAEKAMFDSNAGRYVRRPKEDDMTFSDLLDSRRGKEELQKAIKAAAWKAEYEDEYDDSFDELGQYVADAGGMEETESLADLISGGSRRQTYDHQSTSRSRSVVSPWGTTTSKEREPGRDKLSNRGSSMRHQGEETPFQIEFDKGKRNDNNGTSFPGGSGGSRREGSHSSTMDGRGASGYRRGDGRNQANTIVGDRDSSTAGSRYLPVASGSEGLRLGEKSRSPDDNETRKQERQDLGRTSNDSSSNSGYQYWSPMAERDVNPTETPESSGVGRGRGGRGNRGKGRSRVAKPKADLNLKDGKVYNYKVAGGIGVGSVEEAEAIKRAERETIFGLGEGGNVPTVEESSSNSRQDNTSENGNVRGGRGRGRGDSSGRGRGRGGGDNHSRKDKAMHKHFSGLSGY